MTLFWPEEIKRAKGKAAPPKPTWLEPSYLPGLEEALAFDVDLLSEDELITRKGQTLVCDCETYENYVLVAFGTKDRKYTYIEFDNTGFGHCMDIPKLKWILNNFKIVTFNGIYFDIPILALVLAAKTTGEIKHAASMLIEQQIQPWLMLKSFKVEQLNIDHVDLIEVCPLSASLKIYGGRLHVPRMQDLPFPPDTILSPEQIAIVRHYCINDLVTTEFVNEALTDQLAIRREMSQKYTVDLRSKSDAQIAETVIKKELKRLNGTDARRPEIDAGTVVRYKVPDFVKFRSVGLAAALETIRSAKFRVAESGAVEMPPELAILKIEIGKAIYKMGIGGLHSTENGTVHKADEQFRIVDRDVASYYPQIILNQELYPEHLGKQFLYVYESLVKQRLSAKNRASQIEKEIENLKKLLPNAPD